MNEKRQISSRQKQFVDEYSVSRNGASAAARAGYSKPSAKVTAARLLTKANVRAALAVREAENAQALGVTRERVLAEVQAAINVATGKGDAMAMIAGWREVAKLCGYYAPRQTPQSSSVGRDATANRICSMSDAELAALDGGHDYIVTVSNCN